MNKSLHRITLNEEKKIGDVVFPLTLGPPSTSNQIFTFDDTLNYLEANKSSIIESLFKYGAVLFRGFPVQSPKDFNDFALQFGWEELPYIGTFSLAILKWILF